MKNKLIFAFIFCTSLFFNTAKSEKPDSVSGYIIEHEAQLAKIGTGPHQGKGKSTAYVFFKDVKDLQISFQKHVLHPGSEVGYHKQERDEIYYIVNGAGKIVVDEKSFDVKPGDAILTRKGSHHGMMQIGKEDLIFIVSYPKN